MVRKIVIIAFILIGGSLGFNYLFDILSIFNLTPSIAIFPWVGLVVGGVIGWFVGMMAVSPIENAMLKANKFFSEQNLSYLLFGSLGLALGLIISWLINTSLESFSIPILSDVVPIIITLLFAYFGFYIGSTRREEIKNLFLYRQQKQENDIMEQKEGEPFKKYKVLDTSVIIDGRILDVVRSGFLEGIFLVSHHVLQELQHIADSSDSLKRARGRRGLDILNAFQKEKDIQVEMNDEDISEAEEVDMKLVHLAKKVGGCVVTNDYNLNKVAEFQNVSVLNINELANVVKPVVIPGETMDVFIVKNGTEREQGVAYLDDGTMIVVEEGKHYMNEKIEVMVTSSLQTNAGRMIFSKLSNDQKAIGEPSSAN